MERELCEMLGVSRTPVREALRRLSSDGFVDFVPGRGTVVTRLTMDDMVHVYELKEALDKMAVKLCIQRKTDELMEKLGKSIEEHDQALKNNDCKLVADVDFEFHIHIIMGTRNPKIENISKNVMLQTRRLSQVSVFDPTGNLVFFEHHRKMYEAIKENQVGAAEQAVTEHMESIKAFLTARFDQFF